VTHAQIECARKRCGYLDEVLPALQAGRHLDPAFGIPMRNERDHQGRLAKRGLEVGVSGSVNDDASRRFDSLQVALGASSELPESYD
jgi:hypothetical protein